MMVTWDELRRSVRLAGGRRCRPASDSDLDSFEEHAQIRLPSSYREFAKIFGACEVGHGEVRIATPGRGKKSGWVLDLGSFYDTMREITLASLVPATSSIPPASDPARLSRAVFFASNGKSSWYFWDPRDLGEGSGFEYAVYERHGDSEPYTRLTSSFREFVLEYCLGRGRWLDADGPDGEKVVETREERHPPVISPK